MEIDEARLQEFIMTVYRLVAYFGLGMGRLGWSRDKATMGLILDVESQTLFNVCSNVDHTSVIERQTKIETWKSNQHLLLMSHSIRGHVIWCSNIK